MGWRFVPLALAFYVHLLLLGLISLAWNVVAALLWAVLPAHRGSVVGRTVISSVYRAFWRVCRVTGMLDIDASALDALQQERGLLIAANHPSMMDAMILAARLPRCAIIMKAELMRNPFLAAGAGLARYVCNDSMRVTLRSGIEELRAGGLLVVFPEGTRSTRQPVNPFRPGVTTIAKMAPAPIQTVFIETDSPYLAKGWPIWRLPQLPVKVQVRLGRRFTAIPDTEAMTFELEQYFAAHVKPMPHLER